MLNILFTGNWLRNRNTEHFGKYGISSSQYNILRILRGSKGTPLSMHTVKERMIDRSPNATRLTDKLIEKGYVSRIRCEKDRRVVYISITPTGLELLERIDKSDQALEIANSMKCLSDEEAEILSGLLDRIRG